MLNKRISFFISVVETGSFSKAAKEFYLSQSAISQQIFLLEEELNIRLFDRSGYRPVLTAAGKYYYEECKKLLLQYKEIESNLIKFTCKEEEKIKIGITGPLENKNLPTIIEKYKSKYNNVKIEIKKIKFGEGVENLESGDLDVCFGITNDFNSRKNIKTFNLLKHKVCVICSKNHPLSGKKSVSTVEIAEEPIISLSRSFGRRFYNNFIEAFRKDGVVPNIVQEVDDLEELLLAVRINQGIAFISREVIASEDEICVLDIENTHHHADFCIGVLEKNYNGITKSFIDITTDHFKEKL